MKREKNSNSGFTLVELIIAMAILSFLMTAVVAFMSAGVYSFRKAKADVSVHNGAQAVYNEMTEATMQANDVVILAYKNEGTTLIDFTVPGSDIDPAVKLSTDPCYFVKDDSVKDRFMKTAEYKANPAYTFEYYKDLDPETVLYVKSIITERGMNIDINDCYKVSGLNKYYDGFAIEAGETGDSTMMEINSIKLPGTSEPRKDYNGNVVYDTTDSMRSIYDFDGNKMYYQRKYQYMIKRNDYLNFDISTFLTGSATGDNLKNYLFSDSFSYVKLNDTESITGIIAKVNADAGTIYFDFKFNDKNMTYASYGVSQIRNSYVLKPKGSRVDKSE